MSDKYAVSDVAKFEAVMSGLARYFREASYFGGIHAGIKVDSVEYPGKKDEINTSIWKDGTYYISYRPWGSVGFDCKNNITYKNCNQVPEGPVPQGILDIILNSGILEHTVERVKSLMVKK